MTPKAVRERRKKRLENSAMDNNSDPMMCLGNHDGDNIFTPGRNLYNDLIRRTTFVDCIRFHLFDEQPDEQLNKQPGAMLVDMNEHGITRSTKAKPARCLCTQQPLESEVALMSLDTPFIGPTDNAMEWAA